MYDGVEVEDIYRASTLALFSFVVKGWPGSVFKRCWPLGNEALGSNIPLRNQCTVFIPSPLN
jgi:hypothetical protein